MPQRKKSLAPPITRIILYVKNIPKVAGFYQRHFAMKPLPSTEKGWLELTSGNGGCNIALHQGAVTQKSGAAIKIVFGVADVQTFVTERERAGLKFGPIHDTGEFQFANTKDPAGNSVSISSRAMKSLR